MFAKKSKTIKNLKNLLKQVRYSSNQNHSHEEVRIPVPWGHVSGKWWGPQNKRPILGIHGWQDNSGTFDTLAPYLTTDTGLLAIDLPGHGLSSKLPPGVFYHGIDYVILIKRIVEYFNWSKVSLLGHSLGGITAYLYSVFYPTTVDFLICLDAIKPVVVDFDEFDEVATYIKYFIKYDNLNSAKTEPPGYTFQELEQSLHTAAWKSVSLETCKYILQRNIAPSTKAPNKYYLTRDARLKARTFLIGWPNEFVLKSAYKLTCPTFMSKANCRALPFENKLQAEDMLEIIKKVNRNFEFHNVEGTHHVHLNNPERLEGLIKNFIAKYDVEKRFEGGLKEEIRINKGN